MGFDLENVSTSLSDEGVEMEVINPKNGTKTGWFIKLAGVDSEAFRRAQKAVFDEFMAKHRHTPDISPDPEEGRERSATILAAVTLGWRGAERNGEELKFSPEAVRDLYLDRRYAWLVKQVDAFVGARVNFMPA